MHHGFGKSARVASGLLTDAAVFAAPTKTGAPLARALLRSCHGGLRHNNSSVGGMEMCWLSFDCRRVAGLLWVVVNLLGVAALLLGVASLFRVITGLWRRMAFMWWIVRRERRPVSHICFLRGHFACTVELWISTNSNGLVNNCFILGLLFLYGFLKGLVLKRIYWWKMIFQN